MPHDYRRDPFIDADMSILKVERHLVPATSPYVVALNEIPQKNNPSTMMVKEIDSFADGSAVYGASFAEVAASPSAGQFWPDYSTSADGDQNWNTGKLQFNSADAGKLVEVTYTATGTLASVTSNRYPSWWLDRGDGSDGDFWPTENTTISGLKQYRSVFIPAGVTVTISRWAILQCQGAFVVKGTLTANGQGARGGGRNGGIGSSEQAYASAGGAGGGGGAGGTLSIYGLSTTATAIYIYKNLVIAFGGGGGGGGAYSSYDGGAGGNGGGSLKVVAKSIILSGTITAKGANGGGGDSGGGGSAGGGGGGGGGAIIIVALRISNNGTLSVAGGTGGAGNQSGAAGGAGLIFTKELGVS